MESIKTLEEAIKMCEKWGKKRKRSHIRFLDELDEENDPTYYPGEEGPIQSRCMSDMDNLYRVLPSLKKLHNVVGMDDVKNSILDQVLFYCQGLNIDENMHTVITGPPGVGKTTLGKILSEIYSNLGMLEPGKFRVVSRSDFIAGYVGQTALKTKKLLDQSIGGVLFIDEAYSLGDDHEGGYAREAIDTINKFLMENTQHFVMILAGYKDDIDKNFFTYNKGLNRRFPWRYDIKDYKPNDLSNIFIQQVYSQRWKIDKKLKNNDLSLFFDKHKDFFKDNGGDTLLLFEKAKIQHSRRVFSLPKNHKRVITLEDIDKAFEVFKNHKKPNKKNDPPFGMYC
jgi:SpoVK/Ycf46/Vps4 family AAA+-type ATPase